MGLDQRIRLLPVAGTDRFDDRPVLLARGLPKVVCGLQRQPDVGL
jgi:hypothetical protein